MNSLLPAHRHAVDAAELEKAHDVPGKYTEGLMMREWSACDEDEDVVTMALTAVRRLVERYTHAKCCLPGHEEPPQRFSSSAVQAR